MQLQLFDFPPQNRIIFILHPKNKKIEIITQNCGNLWDLIDIRKNFEGVEEYLLRSSGPNYLTYWVRLNNDNNFWIERWFKWEPTVRQIRMKSEPSYEDSRGIV